MNRLQLSALVLLAASCASTGGSSLGSASARVNTSLLSKVSREKMAPVKIAQSEFSVTKDALENAGRQAKLAGEAVEIAQSELGVLGARVDAARVALGVARAENVDVNIDASTDAYLGLLDRAQSHRMRLTVAKRERDVAVLRKSLAAEEHALAEAELQLARAEALESRELTPDQAVASEDLMADVLYHRAEVALAAGRLDTARRTLEAARRGYEAAQSAPAAPAASAPEAPAAPAAAGGQ